MNCSVSDLMVGRYTQAHALPLAGTVTQLCEGLNGNAKLPPGAFRQIAQAALDRGTYRWPPHGRAGGNLSDDRWERWDGEPSQTATAAPRPRSASTARDFRPRPIARP
ncbi:MAG: hypothetical protein BWZ02_00614 [Lentisphaerae bacterium ADurb.BinA184]|nr:MAG: hypothetical protein BWZ02_00614 [Lentisphaerae bacterium ADurb.BinA184]